MLAAAQREKNQVAGTGLGGQKFNVHARQLLVSSFPPRAANIEGKPVADLEELTLAVGAIH